MTTTPPATPSPLHTYAAALLSIVLVIVQAFVTTTDLSVTTIIQLAIVAVAAIGTYLVPILSGVWAGGAKTGVAVVGAILSALVPLVTGADYSPQTVGLVVLAAVQALAVEIGVSVRKDALKLA